MKKFYCIIAIAASSLFFCNLADAQRNNIPMLSSTGNKFGSAMNVSERGYHGMVEIGPCFGFGGPDVGFDLSTSHGYDFNPHLFVGGGMGLNLVPGVYTYYSHYNVYDEFLVKLYGEVRGYLLRSAVTPYLGLKLGPSFYTSSVDSGRVEAYVEASAGARWKFYRDYAVNLALSADTGWDYCGSLCIKVGFEF